MTRSTPQNELKRLVHAYNALLEVRKKAIGVVMSENCVDVQDDKENLAREYANLALDTRFGRSGIRNIIIKLFDRDRHYSVKAMLRRIEESKAYYMNQTHIRSQYGTITPIAFCAESEISRYLGMEHLGLACDLERTWYAEFQQLNAESTNTGLLELVGVSRSDLTNWWSEGTSDTILEETRVWRDMKNLSIKLVHAFDRVNQEGGEWNSLSMVKLDDRDSQDRVNNIVAQLMRLGQNLMRLLFIRQDDFSKILPLYEMIVPVVYAFSMTLSLSAELWQTMGSQIVSFLEEYISSLCAQRDALIEQLGAIEEMILYTKCDGNIISTFQQSPRQSTQALADPNQKEVIASLQKEIVHSLKQIGLPEKRIVIPRDVAIGTGSFAKVYKGHEENGRQELAVKFLKFKPNNPARIKNRLLREATVWKKLESERCISLLGFCVHPGQEFPGLISPYCEYTPETYLEENGPAIGVSERLCYLYEIANGLDYLHKHEEKLSHGDLRPGNVLLVQRRFGTGYHAILSDFGVSYPLDGVDGINVTSLQQTNELYLAPELLMKDSGKERMVTIPGDIYAFGCVFLEVMYNLTPFYYYSSSVRQLRKEKKTSNLLPALEEDIQRDHWRFLERACDSKPLNRPSSDDLMFHMHTFRP